MLLNTKGKEGLMNIPVLRATFEGGTRIFCPKSAK